MAHNYVVTAQHPTSVNVCDTVRLKQNRNELFSSFTNHSLAGQLHGSRRFESDNWEKHKN